MSQDAECEVDVDGMKRSGEGEGQSSDFDRWVKGLFAPVASCPDLKPGASFCTGCPRQSENFECV